VLRAFVAVSITPRIIARIAATISQLTPRMAGIRWVVPDNIHLTLKFLGAIEESSVAPVGEALRAQLRLFQPFPISVKGLGVFPGPRRPRVLWVGLTGKSLAPLASRVEAALQPLGFAPESRQFTPHLTIGRWRDTGPPSGALTLELSKWQNYPFGECSIASVQLMQSLLRPGGAQYQDLLTVPLGES
jgi:2'-5' RNA ligase